MIFPLLMNYMAIPSDSAVNSEKIRVICKVSQPLQSLSCFFSFNQGESWSMVPMFATSDLEYVVYIWYQKTDLKLWLFFLLENFDGVKVVDSNDGIFYEISLNSASIADHSLNISLSLSSTSNSTPLVNSKESKNSNSLQSVNEKSISSISASVRADQTSVIYAENPFRNQIDQTEEMSPHKIIRFQSSPIKNLQNPKPEKKAPLFQNEILNLSVCPNCQGNYPKHYGICPYCGSKNSK